MIQNKKERSFWQRIKNLTNMLFYQGSDTKNNRDDKSITKIQNKQKRYKQITTYNVKIKIQKGSKVLEKEKAIGLIEFDRYGTTNIYIKNDSQAVLTLIHELTHLVDFIFQIGAGESFSEYMEDAALKFLREFAKEVNKQEQQQDEELISRIEEAIANSIQQK